ncbi:uncharacterized protein LOC142982813 [Anticarsia gemmatalis]|uniref:uncharacterized protein LOC142982813 n=1 Tax=Anticarsia gemmatalis TaxID=129554 RepID=UPI003F76BB0D
MTNKNKQNVVLNDFFSIFLPFYYINTIAGVRKFNIKNKCIENISINNIICAVFINCVVCVFFYIALKDSMLFPSGIQPVIQIIYYGVYLQYVIHICILTFVNLYYSKDFILIHLITAFIQNLVYIGVILIYSKSRLETHMLISHISSVIFWTVKVLIVEVTFCLTCERLYTQVNKGKIISLLKATEDGILKPIWKNIYRLLHQDFHKMSTYGVFTMDAALLLHFCQLGATYTIVLLQFAFL